MDANLVAMRRMRECDDLAQVQDKYELRLERW